jgi:hypothetical protein
MIWSDVRENFHNQWLIIEALDAHTTPDNQRHLDRVAVIERCASGSDAMQKYRRLHLEYPTREFYFVNTSREELDIRERQWLGIRT